MLPVEELKALKQDFLSSGGSGGNLIDRLRDMEVTDFCTLKQIRADI